MTESPIQLTSVKGKFIGSHKLNSLGVGLDSGLCLILSFCCSRFTCYPPSPCPLSPCPQSLHCLGHMNWAPATSAFQGVWLMGRREQREAQGVYSSGCFPAGSPQAGSVPQSKVPASLYLTLSPLSVLVTTPYHFPLDLQVVAVPVTGPGFLQNSVHRVVWHPTPCPQ